MRDRFEANRSAWTLTVSHEEMGAVRTMTMSRHMEIISDGTIWMMSDGRRRTWVLGDEHESIWLHTPGRGGDPRFPLPVPVELIDSALDLVLNNSEETLDIFWNDADRLALATVDGRYTAVDLPPDRPMPPGLVPPDLPGRTSATTRAVMTGSDFVALILLATRHPADAPHISSWHPHVDMEIGNGHVVATVDWRRFGRVRVTRAFPAVTTGSGTISHLPADLRYLHMLWEESTDEMTVFLDPREPGHVCFAADHVGLRTLVIEDHVRRNIEAVCEALSGLADEQPPRRGADVHPVRFSRAGRPHVLEVLEVDGTDLDQVAVSVEVAGPIVRSAEATAEVNRHNALLAGPTLNLIGDSVRATMVFPASDLSRLSEVLALLDEARESCASLEDMLPLMSE